jgi:hypothetical protein
VGFAEILAILAVAISALSVFATYRLGVRRFVHERTLDDRKDSRSTLAEGALALSHANTVIENSLAASSEALFGRGDWPSDFGDHIVKLEQVDAELELAVNIVQIRFPSDDETVTELDAALDSVRLLIIFFHLWESTEIPPEDDLKLWNQAGGLQGDFYRHRKNYIAAAQKAVGAKLD